MGRLRPAKTPAPEPAAGIWLDRFVAIGIAAATIAVYSVVRAHGFLNYDDPYYVTENPHVLAGLRWSGVVWAFTTFEDGNWFPLTWLSHMLDVSLWGIDAGRHHLTSVVIHALGAATLFAALRVMRLGRATSALVAALFALHPLRVESVAWIAERKDVLSGLFCLVTLASYGGYARKPTTRRYVTVLAAFTAALMAKAMPVTLPLVLLLLDIWPLGRSRSTRWVALVREKAPLLALAGAVSVVAFLAQSGAGATATLAPLGARLGNALVTYVMYLGDTVWPANLAVFYPRPAILEMWRVAAAGAFLGGLSWLVWRWRASHPYALVGWVWYLVMLLPVIGLVQIGAQARADRYTYLPLIGVYLAVAAGLSSAVARAPKLRWPIVVAAAGVVVGFAAVTSVQLRVWRDSVTLFEHARRVTPPNFPTLNNLGEALATAGDTNRAAEAFAGAVAVAPANAAARVNLATALNRIGRVDQAAVEFREAVRLDPSNAAAHAGLGAALARQGDASAAVLALKEAARLDPANADVHYNLGNVLARMERLDEAVASLRVAVQLKPDDPVLRVNLGAMLANLGRFDEAITEFTEALRIDPSLESARANRELAVQLKAGGKGR